MHINLARFICIVACCVACNPLSVWASASVKFDAAQAAASAGQYRKATADYEKIVKDVTRTEGEFSMKLVEPLRGLGRSLVQLGHFAEATDALRHAQLILHRNQGVDTLKQLDIIDLLTDIHLDEDKPKDANREQEFSLYISEHNFGKDSSELLPAIYKLTRWYMNTGQYNHARLALNRAIRLISKHFGSEDPRLIEPLMLSAKNARLQKTCCSYKYLDKAREIVERNKDVPSDTRAEVYLALADANIASGRQDRAVEGYGKAWQVMGSSAAKQAMDKPQLIAMSRELSRLRRATTNYYRTETDPFGHVRLKKLMDDEVLRMDTLPPQLYFVPKSPVGRRYHLLDGFMPTADQSVKTVQRMVGSPFQFYYSQLIQILPLQMQSPENVAKLVIHLDFSVQADGSVDDVAVSSDVRIPSRLRSLMKRVLYRTTFRPRIVDGKPVTTKHVTLTQTFTT